MKTMKFYKNQFCPITNKVPTEDVLKSDCGAYCTAEHCEMCRDIFIVKEINENDKSETILYKGTNQEKAEQILDGTYGIDSHFQIDREPIGESDLKCTIYGSDIMTYDIIKLIPANFTLSSVGDIDIILDNLRKLYTDCCMSPMPSNQYHRMEYVLPAINDSFDSFRTIVFELAKDQEFGQYVPIIRIDFGGSGACNISPIKQNSEIAIRRAFMKTIEFFSAIHAVMENLAPERCKYEVLQKRKEFYAHNQCVFEKTGIDY